MNITNILSAALLSMDERNYNKSRRGSGKTVKEYERRRRMYHNYTETDSFDNRYPEISSQFMRR